jgi:hypothetical protein
VSHTIYASFARDKKGHILHVGDRVYLDRNSFEYEVREIKIGGNLVIGNSALPFTIGVKSHNVTKAGA